MADKPYIGECTPKCSIVRRHARSVGRVQSSSCQVRKQAKHAASGYMTRMGSGVSPMRAKGLWKSRRARLRYPDAFIAFPRLGGFPKQQAGDVRAITRVNHPAANSNGTGMGPMRMTICLCECVKMPLARSASSRTLGLPGLDGRA